MANQRVITVGIAGQGRSGYKIHADWLRHDQERFRIVAVADPLPERCHSLAQEFGAKTYLDHEAMLAAGGFEVLVNATPSPYHVESTVAALAAGYHVLCEKPMAPTVAEFDRMTAAAAQAGRILAPFQNNRLQPFFIELLDLVRSGVLGELLNVRSVWGGFNRRWDWQTFQCNLGGCLFNTGPHAIDQALQFFPLAVTPQVVSHLECRNELGGDADDFCSLTLTAPGCPQVEILISQYLAYPQGDMYSISGTRGGLAGGYEAMRWKYYDGNAAPPQELWRPWSLDQNYPGERLPWVEQHWRLDEATAGRSVGYTLRSYAAGAGRIYDGLYHAVTSGAPLTATLPEVRRQIAVIEACHRQNPLPRKLSRWP